MDRLKEVKFFGQWEIKGVGEPLPRDRYGLVRLVISRIILATRSSSDLVGMNLFSEPVYLRPPSSSSDS